MITESQANSQLVLCHLVSNITFKAPCKRMQHRLANNSQHCWMLQVASVCTRCCVLLGVVAQRLKPVKLFSYVQTLNNVRSCWPTVLRPFARCLRTVF